MLIRIILIMIYEVGQELNYESFSLDIAIQRMAKESVLHTSKIYPIYVFCKYHAGKELSENQILFLDAMSEFAEKYDIDITLVYNEQDNKTYYEYNKENEFKLKLLQHSCYDSNVDLSNNRSKIKNFIMKSAFSRFGNKNLDWMFLIDEGVKFKRISGIRNNENVMTDCLSADNLLIFFSIWQYYATKMPRTIFKDENQIGLAGLSRDSNLMQFSIDKDIIENAFLINAAECNRRHIEFEQMIDLEESIDFNMSIVSNGLHLVLLTYPIFIEPMLEETWTQKKQNNMNLNLWAKWGDKVVQKFKVEDGCIKPVLVNSFENIILEYNSSNKHRIVWPKNEQMYAEYLSQKKKILN